MASVGAGDRVGHNGVIDEVNNAITGEVTEDLPAFEQSFDSRFDLVFSMALLRSGCAGRPRLPAEGGLRSVLRGRLGRVRLAEFVVDGIE